MKVNTLLLWNKTLLLLVKENTWSWKKIIRKYIEETQYSEITIKVIFFPDSLCIYYPPKGLYTCLFRVYRKNWAVKGSKCPGENGASAGGIDIHDHVPFSMLSSFLKVRIC